jgi:hypothetical protein
LEKNGKIPKKVCVLTPLIDSSNFAFIGWKIRDSNVELAWEKMRIKNRLKAEEISKPEISAYAVIDSDYDLLHRHFPEHTISFGRVHWEKMFSNPKYAEIFIRNSVFDIDRNCFYNALEIECEKLMKLCITAA